MRQVNALITVTLIRDPDWQELHPSAFRYRGTVYRVATVLDRWNEAGQWWEQAPEETVWRVTDGTGGVYELAQVHKEPPEWRLRVIWD